VILSDRSIRKALAEGRIVIEPLDETSVQPSSVDLHVDRYFRVFRNHTMGYIDVKENQEDLTELVEIGEEAVFILPPGEFVLGSTSERVQLPDDLVARLEGKALALDTPVPTPNGWRSMGDLGVGDEVFDERGRPTSVVAATPPMLHEPCREVVFSDGTTIVADVRHQWLTCDKSGRRHRRRRWAVRTTDEIAATLLSRGRRNHQVPLTEPVGYPARELPTDPYVEGVRLGEDSPGAEPVAREYLIAAPVQRHALLRGLMDSGGLVEGGRWEFTHSDEGLADAVVELASSLGFCPVKAKGRAMLDGVECGPTYRVRFTPHRPVFRAICAVREVPTVPVRCIQVASRSGLFLVTRAFIPTHNSSLGRLGLLIHSTAGFVDAGWNGHLTLELSNVANLPITLYPGMKIGQISFLQMTTAADNPYGSTTTGSKYQGQRGPTPSRYFENFR
jgi:deoxycytidine triphosphate deaminase